MKHHFSLVLPAWVLTTFAAAASTTSDVDHGKAQIEWLRSRGGFVSSKLEIRKVDPTDEYSRTAMFASGSFKEGETLLLLPTDAEASVVMNAEGHEDELDDEQFQCALARNLIVELRLGKESKYSAYVNYLNDQPHGQLPSAYSDAGKKLLTKILGNVNGKSLPPEDPVSWVPEWAYCVNMDDPLEQNAMMMVLQRSWNDLLLPVYDMMSHRNGHYFNTANDGVHEEEQPINVYASRDIDAGEEIYTSSNLCEDCSAPFETYGTPEIFRDYGFVEQYPQRWIIDEYDLAFEITDEVDDDESDSDKDVTLNWLFDTEVTPSAIAYMRGELHYLQTGIGKTFLENADPAIPKHELDMIQQYVAALEFAFEFALEVAGAAEESCEETGTCTAGMVDLSTYEQEHQWYWIDTCDNSEVFREFEDLEEIQSQYQLIGFFRDPENNDMCFELDSVTQICTSYRPHYHEMLVSYVARFLPKIERVLFVGGGDSMLLHEILKYPALEVVVGLEIDQKVTRNCFKYFGSQPHWDNDKVQWWFGDAAKSLMMLPESYFGTFDLVLVDLSETVMSLKVTDGLDIMEALGLLLKPEGILVKNEMYFEKMKEIYEHATHLRFYDCPVICHQGISLGSHRNPMIPNTLTDHGLPEPDKLLKPLTVKDHHSIIHSYNRDETKNGHCKREGDLLGAVPDTQQESPGILMIVEAEDIAVASESMEAIQERLAGAVANEGLTVLSSFASSDDTKVVTITMEEGFIIAKIFGDENYCALDIHMWSRTWKQVDVKEALLAALGSKSSSQLRVVAGGMFGMSTWRDDQSKRGPRRTDPCEETEKPTLENPLDQTLIDTIVKESLNFAPDGIDLIAVVCGLESDGNCQTLEALKKFNDAKDILPIWTCPDISGYDEDMVEKTVACKESVIELMEEDERCIDGLILDPSVSMGMSGVVAKALGPITWTKYLDEEALILSLAPMLDTPINWRPNFFKRVHTELMIHEPAFRSEIDFNRTLILNVLTKNEEFTIQLNETTKAIEKETGLVAEVRKVRGGHFHYQHEWDPTHFFKPSDYDQSGPWEQWNSQKPLERQVLFQLEGDSAVTRSKVKGAFELALKKEGISATVSEEKVSGDGSLFVALWSEGRAIALWDGRKHIDINLTFPADIDPAKFDAFVAHVNGNIRGMATMLRDEQSRGIGRVVNFVSDLESTEKPYWML